VASLTDGSVITWGRNTKGELGNGTVTTDSNVPVVVPGLSGITAVSHSWQTAGALDSSGNVWVWGYTGVGQRADGTSPDITSSPVQVPLPLPAVQQSVGGNGPGTGQVLALLNDGTVWAWGCDTDGQVGNGVFQPEVTTPTHVPIKAAVKQIGAGGVFSVVLTNKGTAITWGGNDLGQLGDGNTLNSASPVRLSGMIPTPISVLGFGESSVDALF
jgi:alpha-tubulin suppressor-like RCC1 family protein